jgi:hypothetical protein
MAVPLPALVARPLIRLWLARSPDSWQRRPTAGDSPHVHAPGTNLTHDLGLPGHLARSRTARTGHATDVDIVVDDRMTVRTCAQALADVDLFRYDVVVLSLGHNEALHLMRPAAWRAGLRILLDDIGERKPAATTVFILPIPVFGPRTKLPAALARVLDARARQLDAVTRDLVEHMPGVTVVGDGDGDAYEFQAEDVHVYRVWADGLAAQISGELDADRIPAGSSAEVDEEGRLDALERSGAVGITVDPVLDGLTRTARDAFGTSSAVITLIHRDVQTMISTTGSRPVVIPRDESFCDVTIRRAGHLVVEDATLDSRYDSFPTVTDDPAFRFYAGYPIESPEGHRIGAFCVMDAEPRRFTPDEAALLRRLAQLAQERVWELPTA